MDKAEERVYRLALHYYVHDKNIYTDNFSRKTQYKYQEIMAEVEWKNCSISTAAAERSLWRLQQR